MSPGSLSYGQLECYQGPKPSSLPDGVYALTASTVVGEITTERLAPGNDALEYSQGALRNVRTTFTVPEPGAGTAEARELHLEPTLRGVGAGGPIRCRLRRGRLIELPGGSPARELVVAGRREDWSAQGFRP